MTSGCAPGWPGGADAPDWQAPLVVKESTLRCPDADPSARREARRTTPPPELDTVDSAGKPALSAAALKSKVDELRVSEARKNRALTRVLDEYERCRTGADPHPKIASR